MIGKITEEVGMTEVVQAMPEEAQHVEILQGEADQREGVTDDVAANLGSLVMGREVQGAGLEVTGIPVIQRGRETTRVLLVHVLLLGRGPKPKEAVVAKLSTFEQTMRTVDEDTAYTQRINNNPKQRVIPYSGWQEGVSAADFGVLRDQALELLQGHEDQEEVQALFARIGSKLGLPVSETPAL